MRVFIPILLLAGLAPDSSAARPLSVLLIVADDLGVTDISPYHPKTFRARKPESALDRIPRVVFVSQS